MRTLLLITLSGALAAVAEAQNWPSFRGPGASGVVDPAAGAPPLRWDAIRGDNIAWKTAIPGLGHSSPIVWGDRVFLTTAVSSGGRVMFRPEPLSRDGEVTNVDSAGDEPSHAWKLMALDRRTGKVLWIGPRIRVCRR